MATERVAGGVGRHFQLAVYDGRGAANGSTAGSALQRHRQNGAAGAGQRVHQRVTQRADANQRVNVGNAADGDRLLTGDGGRLAGHAHGAVIHGAHWAGVGKAAVCDSDI